MTTLMHLSESKLAQIRADMGVNLERYCGDGFSDLAHEPGWALEIDSVTVDVGVLAELDGVERTSEADLRNSRTVAKALSGMTPSLANEERIWVRLSHVEAFSYSQARWIRPDNPPEKTIRDIETHFFARTQTGLRDDHAVSRLWWNSYIATHCYPQDPDRGLQLLLTRADVRSNLVERIWLTGRRKLASGVFRAMERDGFLLQSEGSFREFMKALNLLGGGVVFESMPDNEIDRFLAECSEYAAQQTDNAD